MRGPGLRRQEGRQGEVDFRKLDSARTRSRLGIPRGNDDDEDSEAI